MAQAVLTVRNRRYVPRGIQASRFATSGPPLSGAPFDRSVAAIYKSQYSIFLSFT